MNYLNRMVLHVWHVWTWCRPNTHLLSIISFIMAGICLQARLTGLVQNKDLAAPVTLYGDMKHWPLTPRLIQMTVLSHRPPGKRAERIPRPAAAAELLWRVSARAAKTLVTFVFATPPVMRGLTRFLGSLWVYLRRLVNVSVCMKQTYFTPPNTAERSCSIWKVDEKANKKSMLSLTVIDCV